MSKINNLLLTLIIAVNAYLILAPVLPAIFFHVGKHTGEQQRLQKMIKAPTGTRSSPASSQPNQVIIPSMLLDQPILEGPESQQYKILDKGIWRFQWSSTPDKGGNTVLIGHRFTYTNPRGVFYFLNKVSLGDDIGVVWNNRHYVYQVVTINEVPPNDTAIEKATPNPELTLFTCTPLWLPKDRLVVVADLETKS